MLNARLRRGGPVLRLLMSVAVGIIVGAGALVFARTEMTSMRYRLSHLLEAESELRTQVDKLRVEVAALSAPERVEPRAVELGLTQSSLARQIRQAFYGEEIQRLQRGRDEVRVMLRFPEEDRRSLDALESMRIRTPGGGGFLPAL